MRFMIIVKATQDTEAGVMPEEKLIASMAAYHEELARAGALLDASGLQPSAKGWRIRYCGEKRSFVDGPFAEAKELIAGYTIIQAKSRDEAVELTRRFPNPAGDGREAEIEVRQLFELEDFGPSEAIERFRDIGVGGSRRPDSRSGDDRRFSSMCKVTALSGLPCESAMMVIAFQ